MPNFDETVGSNVSAYRQSQGMSQADLARAMSRAGHAFHQQTIQKLEKGLRPLRLEEAIALADLLDVDVTVLWDIDVHVDANASLLAARNKWQNSLEALERAAATFADMQDLLRATARTFGESANPQLQEDVLHALSLDAGVLAHNAAVRQDAVRTAENSLTPELITAAHRPAKEA